MITLCTCRGHHSDQHVCHAYAGLCSCRALASLANLVAGCACAQAFSYRDSLSGTSMTARVAGFCFLLTVAFRSRVCTLRARYPLGKPQRTLSSAAASSVVSEVASGKAFAASRGRLGKSCCSPARSPLEKIDVPRQLPVSSHARSPLVRLARLCRRRLWCRRGRRVVGLLVAPFAMHV